MTHDMTTNSTDIDGLTVGQRLRAAREAYGLTPADVAAATNMLAHLVILMENDDFGSMGAPVYTKGFIKMYAKYLGLDPVELVAAYNARDAGRSQNDPVNMAPPAGKRKSATKKPVNPRPKRTPRPKRDLLGPAMATMKKQLQQLKAVRLKKLSSKARFRLMNIGAGLLLLALILFLSWGIHGCVAGQREQQRIEDQVRLARESIMAEPPEPYITIDIE